MKAPLDEQNLIRANALFWEQMLDLRLEPMASAEEFRLATAHTLSFVLLGGVWRGRIEVRMAQGLASLATAAMLMQSLESVGDADVLDAAKEIANMIAGTLKSSLPRPCSMSVPESQREPGGFSGVVLSEDSLVAAFRHPAGDMMVRVCEEECAAA